MNKLIIIFSLFLAGASISGCNQNISKPPKTLYLSSMDEVSPEFQQKIYEAIAALNQEAGVEIVSLSTNVGKPLNFLKKGNDTTFAHAQYLDYRCLIQIDELNQLINNNSAEQLDLKYVLLHEIGHCYGHPHVDDSSHLMYEDYPGTPGMNVVQINNVRTRINNFLQEIKLEFF